MGRCLGTGDSLASAARGIGCDRLGARGHTPSELSVEDCTGDHRDVCEFVKAMEAENGL